MGNLRKSVKKGFKEEAIKCLNAVDKLCRRQTENWPLDFSSEHVKSLMILTKVGTVE